MTAPSLRRRVAAAALAVTATTSLAACTGGGDSGPSVPGEDEPTPAEVLAAAGDRLDETSGVRLSLSTDDEPDSDAYLVSAEGVVIRDPAAFEGTASGVFRGQAVTDLSVVSVDGDFQVDLPVVGYQTFDPDDLCAPDPAMLLSPGSGVSTVLTDVEDAEEGDSERGGPDNAEVLTTYTGTVPGEAITNVLPCAPGDSFDATFTVNDDGYLRSAALTGEFFSGGGDLTYTIDVEDYDVQQDIKAP